MTAASMCGSVRSFSRERMMRICASLSSFFTGRFQIETFKIGHLNLNIVIEKWFEGRHKLVLKLDKQDIKFDERENITKDPSHINYL